MRFFKRCLRLDDVHVDAETQSNIDNLEKLEKLMEYLNSLKLPQGVIKEVKTQLHDDINIMQSVVHKSLGEKAFNKIKMKMEK